MAAVIIRQKDVKRLGKELLNEMFEFLHDEYILTEYEDMKKVKREFLNNLIVNHVNTMYRRFEITDEKRQELLKDNRLNHIKSLIENYIKTDEKRTKLAKLIYDKKPCVVSINFDEVDDVVIKELDSNDVNDVNDTEDLKIGYSIGAEDLRLNAMKDDGIDTEGIYHTLNSLKLDMEIDEDLYYKTNAFLDIFRVFENGYSY